MSLIDRLAETLSEKNLEFVLAEDGEEIGIFDSIVSAKHELQSTYGEGQALEWIREEDDKGRRLRHNAFTISVRKKS